MKKKQCYSIVIDSIYVLYIGPVSDGRLTIILTGCKQQQSTNGMKAKQSACAGVMPTLLVLVLLR